MKKLTLTKETLRALNGAEITHVDGGSGLFCPAPSILCPTVICPGPVTLPNTKIHTICYACPVTPPFTHQGY